MGMMTSDRIEDFAITMASTLRRAKKALRYAGCDDAARAAAAAEVEEARKSFLSALRLYRESVGK